MLDKFLDSKIANPVIKNDINNVSDTTKHLLWTTYKKQFLAIIGVCFIISVPLTFLLKDGRPLGLFILGPLLFYLAIQAKVQRAFMKQFALQNGFKFFDNGPFDSEIGVLFKRGSERKLYNLVVGNLDNYPIRLFNYSYSIKSGKRRDKFIYTVFDLEFNSELPRMYLDAHKDVVGDFINGLKPLILEANEFKQVYSLYITPGSQIDALQVFSPDLMSELLNFKYKFDLELVGHQIYVYANCQLADKEPLEAMFNFAKHIVKNLSYEIERMKRVGK